MVSPVLNPFAHTERRAERGPEAEIITDMVRRGLPAFPVLILVPGLIWGWRGVASAAFAVGLVLVNFALTAVILNATGRRSPNALMVGVLVGYALRMSLIVLALYLAKQTSWAEMVPLGIVLVITHVGLLVSEVRHVSASLAFPGLKPAVRPSREEPTP